jgi:hypothetical protein
LRHDGIRAGGIMTGWLVLHVFALAISATVLCVLVCWVFDRLSPPKTKPPADWWCR